MEKILILEDDLLIRENLSELFTNEGYLVDIAENGKIGIKKASEFNPDLVISDIMMPELGGFEVYKIFKEDPVLSITPFIFLSALNDQISIRKGMSLGIDDFITKPFLNSDLLNAVKSRIEKNKKVKYLMESLKMSLVRAIPHEFLTPLNGIMGFSKIIIDAYEDGEELVSEEIYESVNYIHQSGLKLLRTTKNFILFSELITISGDRNQEVKLRTTLTNQIDSFLPEYIRSYAKNFSRENDIIMNILPATLKIGYEYFRKIVLELLDNAMKFSKKGSKITIETIIDKDFYVLSIQDQGIGMKSSEILKIDSFTQFDRQISEQAGLGLGLFLVKKILEIHQGKLKVDNNFETGIKVTFYVPIYN